jgi:hypothetical protein
MTVKGQDWASYQSSTPSTKGLAFVFIKATEGTSYVNPRMVAQAKHARTAGLVVGFYHFARPGSMKAQAAYFVDKAVSAEGDPLFLDWEDSGVSSADKDAFLAEVQRLRGDTHRVGLYCNQDFWLNREHSGNAGEALWIADYVTAGKPRIKADWVFHQYTDKPVDTNTAAFKDKAALKAWATKAPADDEPEGPADPPKKPTTPAKAPAFPGRQYFVLGAKNAHAKQLQTWLAKGTWGPAYKVGPSDTMTALDLDKVKALQSHYLSALGPADGLTGPKTWQYAYETATGLRKK